AGRDVRAVRTHQREGVVGRGDARGRQRGRGRRAAGWGAPSRGAGDGGEPQQERQKAAREAERGREAWTLGQGMKKPVAGCYGRLTRWKGGGDVVYMALL
ncbi:hypothetical protein C3455_25625, partial [Escherichia coli]